MSGPGVAEIADRALHRIYGEFVEMPGLRLTSGQARRLWGLDETMCRELLDLLVGAGFLRRTHENTYERLVDGRTDWPRPLTVRPRLPSSARRPNPAA